MWIPLHWSYFNTAALCENLVYHAHRVFDFDVCQYENSLKGMTLYFCPISCVMNNYEDMDIKSNGIICKDHVV